MVQPREAATVVLLRPAARSDGPAGDANGGFEVFLQRRVPTMAFAPGMTVFPGGARDPGDDDLRATAVREVLEETGVVLSAADLVPWARWVTPEGEPRRYDALFFVTGLPAEAAPAATGTEMDRVRWMRPAAALEAYAAGELAMMPPTVITLRELDEYPDIAAVLAGAPQRRLDPIRPRILDDEEGIRIELPGGEVFR